MSKDLENHQKENKHYKRMKVEWQRQWIRMPHLTNSGLFNKIGL
jgi:hypothetical protein